MHTLGLTLVLLAACLCTGEPAQAVAPEIQAANSFVTSILATLTTLAALVLTLLKILDRAKIKGLEKERGIATEIATALCEAVDELKPDLNEPDAKHVTDTIQRKAKTRGIAVNLDQLLATRGLNQKPRDQLGANGQAQPPPAPPAPPG